MPKKNRAISGSRGRPPIGHAKQPGRSTVAPANTSAADAAATRDLRLQATAGRPSRSTARRRPLFSVLPPWAALPRFVVVWILLLIAVGLTILLALSR